MKRENDCIADLSIAYIGGGSRGWAWGFMKDLAIDPQMEGTVRLYDIDRDAAEKNSRIGTMISRHPDAKSHWRYQVAESLQEALTGADFVIISILPGTFEEMRSDVHAPEAYGIWQPVGDSVGPGGFIRSLRTVPMYVEIAQAIQAYAPDAWVINYTNPMSVCVRTLYAVFPQIRAVGCCHEVFGTQQLLAAMLEDLEGIAGVDRTEIKTGVTGINHFTWLYSASYRDMDLFPLYRRFVDTYYESGFAKGHDDNWMNNSFASSNRVKFDLFRRYGLIAAAGDRHLAEFLPPWYLQSPQVARSWGFGLTSVDWRVQDLQERLARRERLLNGSEPIVLDGSGEEGHLLMKALLGLGDIVSNVNIPNYGQIPNLPPDAVVETNALFRRGEVAPIFAGPLPPGIDVLVSRQALIQQNTVRAAMRCDRALAFSTFTQDPQVQQLQPDDARALFDTMIDNTRTYLPAGWQQKSGR